MAFFWNPKPPEDSGLRAALREALAPMQRSIDSLTTKVDDLSKDHVRREDLERLSLRMDQGFIDITQRYYTKDVSDSRYHEVQGRLSGHDDTFVTLTTRVGNNEQRGSGQTQQWLLFAAGVALNFLGPLILYGVLHK